eukprot:2337736-Prymnesium_polylepis.1
MVPYYLPRRDRVHRQRARRGQRPPAGLRKEADPPRRLRKRPTSYSPVILMVGRDCTLSARRLWAD